MLLPTKGVSSERALITLGSEILVLLERPTSVSGLWERFTALHNVRAGERVTFDWFSLSLTALFAMNVIDWTADGHLERCSVSA